jgi:DNA-binding XRE family transcriptional regulator
MHAETLTTGGWLGKWVADAANRPGPQVPAAPRETLGARLRRLRKARGLSVADASSASGVKFYTITQIEKGYVANPGVRTLMPLARLYGLSLERLMEGVA